MYTSAIPSAADLGGLLAYVVGNPYLFISSSTAMTTGLLVAAVAVSVFPHRPAAVRAVASALFLVFAYFGAGSFALSLEILMRFHAAIPYETEVQFVSGVGHLLLGLAGMAVLVPLLHGHTRRSWLRSHAAALVYWAFHVTVLTPPWFAFQGQRETVTAAALLLLTTAAAMNAALWARTARRSPRRERDVPPRAS